MVWIIKVIQFYSQQRDAMGWYMPNMGWIQLTPNIQIIYRLGDIPTYSRIGNSIQKML